MDAQGPGDTPTTPLTAAEQYALWLRVVRGELTEAQAAERHGLDPAALRRILHVAEQGALSALSTSAPEATAQIAAPAPPTAAGPGVVDLLAGSPAFVGVPRDRLEALAKAATLVFLGARTPVAEGLSTGPFVVAAGTLLVVDAHDRPVDLVHRKAFRGARAGRRLIPLTPARVAALPAAAMADARARVAVLGDRLDRAASRVDPAAVTALAAGDPPVGEDAGLPHLIDTIAHADTVDALAAIVPSIRSLVQALLAAGADIGDIGRVLATVHDHLMRRLLALAQVELGPAPDDFAWLVFGSHARREQTLGSDQDTGLVYASGLDADGHAWFARLGGWMTAALETCGYARCPGGVMASHPEWRHDLDGWARAVRRWTDRADATRLIGADIGFDVRAVAGTGALAAGDVAERLAGMVADATRNELTVARLARAAVARRPPSALWGRVGQSPLGPSLGARHRRFDLKRHGVQPIVDLARLHTIVRGGTQVGTAERLAATAAGGGLSADLAATMVEGLRLLTWTRLSAQLGGPDDGPEADRVDWAALPAPLRAQFSDTFGAIRSAQDGLRVRYRLAADA
ncbi:MAG TPA: DUF294 nucleotidyltransferase-like domain-containing protein [Euzebyales bacterium]|nr:DUF294 nucleotidyltransferase-like domain-containing protein [Euzebyales bacterium]